MRHLSFQVLSSFFPSADPILGNRGRIIAGISWEKQQEPSPMVHMTIAVPKGLMDIGYVYPDRISWNYRYPIHIKTIWTSAPFLSVRYDDQFFSTIGVSNLLHISTVKIDVSFGLLSYQEKFKIPPSALYDLEAGLSFPPAPRQEIRFGYSNVYNHELNIRYQRSGTWFVHDIQMGAGLESWRIQAGAGVRR